MPSHKDGYNKGQKWYGPKQKQKILRRGGKNTQKNYTTKIFMTQTNLGVITHLGKDILECEVKWALGSITTKLVEVMEFQWSYFKSQNMML